MTKEERLKKQEEHFYEMLSFEKDLWDKGLDFVCGVDEVGRGPLAGPVVTAAVILPKDFYLPGVDDSKKLSPKKRDELYDLIIEKCIAYSIGRREPQRIEEINILNATKEAMVDAVLNLKVRPQHVLIDAVKLKDLDIPQSSIIKGDAKSVSIAAASIVAKVTRDREMVLMAEKYPWYGFESNKGYGTKAHYEGLKEHGPCEIHRKSFL